MTDSTGDTDRRFPAAYQRGYDGPAAESAEQARRPGRPPLVHDATAPRDRTRNGGEPIGPGARVTQGPERARPFDRSVPASSSDDPTAEESPAVDPATSALDRRVPLTLALVGAVFLAIGLAMLWFASSAMYTGNETQTEEFMRTLSYFVPGPAVTVGLVAIGASIALKAARP